MNISKKMLAKQVSDNIDGIPEYKILKIIDVLFNEMRKGLEEGNNLIIRNFGSFYIVTKNERYIIHPNTRETIRIPSHLSVKFTQSMKLKNTFIRKVADESNENQL